MASRFFLSRSKSLILTSSRALNPSSSLIDASASSQCLPAPHCRGSFPSPLTDRVGSSSSSLFGSSKIFSCRPYQVLYGGCKNGAALPFFAAQQCRGLKHEANVAHPELSQSAAYEKNAKLGDKVAGEISPESKPLVGPKVIAFSPLEGAAISSRESALAKESLKIKRAELSQKITFALIPALLLVSKNSLTTSLLVFSVYWQIYGFFKEIFLDYVHHEVTRKWVLIYFQLLLLILGKDTILNFNLV